MVAHRNAVGMLAERSSVSDHPGASRHPSCTRRGARARTVFRNLDSSVAKEGWTRPKENAAKHPLWSGRARVARKPDRAQP